MNDIHERFGRNVYWHRVEQGKTFRELSEASGVAFSHISAIERATVHLSLRHAVAIAEALDVPLADLVFKDAFGEPADAAKEAA